MASQAPADPPVASDSAQTLPDRTQTPADNNAAQGEVSKNAAKKAAKAAKQASEKAGKAANKGGAKQTPKAPKKKPDGPALIGIDVSKEEDFPGWYQQVLTKGEMLDYYDVSGCYILKVGLYLPFSPPRFRRRISLYGVLTCDSARLVLHLGGDPKLVQCAHQEDRS